MGLSKIQIIEETVSYYSEDVSRRAVSGYYEEEIESQCMYYTYEGKVCAFARVLEDPKDFQENCDYSWGQSLFIIGEEIDVDSLMKPQYTGHAISFWRDVQTLHDLDSHWGDNQLTERGQVYVDYLLEKYKD